MAFLWVLFPTCLYTAVLCRSVTLYVTCIKTHSLKGSNFPRDLNCPLLPPLAILSFFVLSANYFKRGFVFTSVFGENVTAAVTDATLSPML